MRRLISNIKIPAVVIGCLMLIYVGFSVVILPKLLASKIPELIANETGRKALVAKVQIQPFPLAINIQGFELQEVDGTVFSQFSDFYIRLGFIKSLQQSALVIEELSLAKPLIHITRHKQGDFNFQSLVKLKADKEQHNITIIIWIPLKIIIPKSLPHALIRIG